MGRPVATRRPGAEPGLWLTDDRVAEPVTAWRRLVDLFPDTGLWPLLLASLGVDERERPWDSGELDPIPLERVDALQAEAVLAEGWADSLVPIGEDPWTSSICSRSGQPSRGSRRQCASVLRPRCRGGRPQRVDAEATRSRALPSSGRHGGIDRLAGCHQPTESGAGLAVLRSCRTVQRGARRARFRHAHPAGAAPTGGRVRGASLAAELAALCPDVLAEDGPLDGFGYLAGGTVAGLARVLVNRPVWTLWWD